MHRDNHTTNHFWRSNNVNNGFFGGIFDFNGDGKLDGFEQAADFAAFMNLIESENADHEDRRDSNNDHDDQRPSPLSK